ncbi:MAG TPA: hypothetical protein VG028_17025 [Terriglobia bacterium]|nr:hypothetical protein [Terriglobia bacterium]
MALRRQTLAVAACLAMVTGGGVVVSLHAAHTDKEEDLLPRIEEEHNPIKKAKLEIRLARVKLLQASGACQKDDHDACTKLLGSYLELVRSSWKDLQSSGKNPVKHPSGFRELDIALREDARTLDDSRREMPFEDRAVLDPVIVEANKVHDQVFAALFPSGSPPAKKKHAWQSHFGGGRSE